MMYHRLSETLNSVGKLIPENANVYDFIKSDKDYYLSIYKYNEEQKRIAEEKVDDIDSKGVAYKRDRGIKGIEDVVTTLLGFDFDHKDLNVAKADTITTVQRLMDTGLEIDDIHVSFSGGKGFSIVVHHDKPLSPVEHRTIAEGLAGDLETFDTTLYNASRIFRIDGTKHNTTGLYKTPLDPDHLHESIDFIKAQAKVKTKRNPVIPTKLPDSVLKLKPKLTIVQKSAEETPHHIDFSKKPFYLTDLKYVLQKGFIPPSDGNEGMMILCSTYKHVGFDRTDAYYMLKSVNEKRAEIYGIPKRSKSEIFDQVINVVYDQSWKGGTYSIENSRLLQETARKFGVTDTNTKDLFSIGKVTDKFRDFALNIDKNTIKLGIDKFDKSVRITTSMLVCLLASPSAGKSSITFGILNSLSRANIPGLFLSLDMAAPLVYQRLIQRHFGYTGDKIFDMYKQNSPDLPKIQQKLEAEYKNIKFSFKSGVLIDDIRNMLTRERQAGNDVKFLAIDYLECLQSHISDSTASKAYIAQALKDIGNEFGICVFLLVQPQKHVGDPSYELNSYRNIKGSSVIEEAASVILTISRPGFSPKNPEKDKFLCLTVVKNRMGSLGSFDFMWDGLTGSIEELDEYEKNELEELRDKKSAEKVSENSGWGL